MLEKLTTEGRNARSAQIDQCTALEIVQIMNLEDQAVPAAVGAEAESIAAAIDVVADRLGAGGRLVYVGAGTSGRLGVLDASECPPTFNSEPWQVVGLIAGGPTALTRAIEGAEDHPEYARQDLHEINFCDRDVLIGIATSGRTPYVIEALRYARELGGYAIGFACNRDTPMHPEADLMITPFVGPEVVTGSTRLKAGTATKLVLNMVTTGAMIRLGKTFGNLMVDLRATNEKLRLRSNRIVRELTGVDEAAAQELLEACDGELKSAVVMHLANVDAETARQRLTKANGKLREAIGDS